MASQKVYVVTGASRGLGLGFVESLLRQPDTVVVAAARSPDKSEALQTLVKEHRGRLHTVTLDSADDASVKARRFSVGQADSVRCALICAEVQACTLVRQLLDLKRML